MDSASMAEFEVTSAALRVGFHPSAGLIGFTRMSPDSPRPGCRFWQLERLLPTRRG